MKLETILEEVNKLSFSLEEAREYLKEFHISEKLDIWLAESHGGYYRKLPLLLDLIGNQTLNLPKVLEIGTYSGLSAVMMARSAEYVDSYDITDVNFHFPFLDKSNVEFHVVTPFFYQRINYHKYNVLFIDIGNHEADHEKWIHNHLIKTNWSGIAIYDDINWCLMRPFWDSITNEKLETDWHGDSGFGLVNYGG